MPPTAFTVEANVHVYDAGSPAAAARQYVAPAKPPPAPLEITVHPAGAVGSAPALSTLASMTSPACVPAGRLIVTLVDPEPLPADAWLRNAIAARAGAAPGSAAAATSTASKRVLRTSAPAERSH